VATGVTTLIEVSGTGEASLPFTPRPHPILSTRWDEPLVSMNCAALPETLIEAELFGHEAGVFTCATMRTRRSEEADKGTLSLDELGTLSMGAQERLLQLGQGRRILRGLQNSIWSMICAAQWTHTNTRLLSMCWANIGGINGICPRHRA